MSKRPRPDRLHVDILLITSRISDKLMTWGGVRATFLIQLAVAGTVPDHLASNRHNFLTRASETLAGARASLQPMTPMVG